MEQRFVVIGNTCAGKSTFGKQLADKLNVGFVELDALYWKPNWQARPLKEFRKLVDEATRGPGWVVAGSYFQQRDISWTRAQSIIWLDLPLPLLMGRVLVRSFRRWRTAELLWGTNRDRFIEQLMIWDENKSLLTFAVRSHLKKRRNYRDELQQEPFSHLTLRRFCSNRDAQRWLSALSTVTGV